MKGGWRIGEYHYDENPRFTVPEWALRLVRRWWQMRLLSKGAMGQGQRVLPRAGGYYDQPAAVMDAFELFDRLAEEGARDDQHPG